MKKTLLILFGVAVVAMGFAAGSGESPQAAAASSRWQDQYPTIVYSTITSENEADRVARTKPLIEYLEKELGVKVESYVASDYAGVVEAQKAGKVHFASYGTASYVRLWMVTDGNAEPLVTNLDQFGSSGYYAVVAVRTDSPYKTMEDLKGKSLAFADPNSTSGYLVPSFYLRKQGMEPDLYFGKTGFAGSHEMGVLAVIQKTYDACATHWTNEDQGNIQRMIGKAMIKADDVRIIWKSPIITNGPIAATKSLPQQMKDDFKRAMLELPTKAPEVYKAMAAPTPPGKGYIAVTHERYLDFLEMTKINDELARKKQ